MPDNVKPDKVKIFISYARVDAEPVAEIYQRLLDAGFDPWIDTEHLLPGVKWRSTIVNAVREADFFLLCISAQSSNRRGFIQREIKAALDLWEEKTPDDIYFIPLRLEECDLPDQVSEFQCVNWFEPNGWDRLMKSLHRQTEKLRDTRPPKPQPSSPLGQTGSKTPVVSPKVTSANDFPFVTIRLNDQGEEISQSRGVAKGEIEDLGGGVLIEMIRLQGGEFWMGSTEADSQTAFADAKRYNKNAKEEWWKNETPRHRVSLSPFMMGRYAVTQAQWFEVMGDLPAIEEKLRGDDHPIVNVNWTEATEFCKELSRRTKHQYRLPTEAEWEYACRAGTNTPFAFGNTLSPEVANYWWNNPFGNGPKQEKLGKTLPLGSLEIANAFGLFDMHGNVWEWCSDWYSDKYYQECKSQGVVTDPQGPGSGSYRVIRGGGWYSSAVDCRSAFRYGDAPGPRDGNLGFRLVRIGR
ncbi:MAG: SUMF1/EgtB/PvdO family nonheme iron enzyme [Blastocatellia bacterium]